PRKPRNKTLAENPTGIVTVWEPSTLRQLLLNPTIEALFEGIVDHYLRVQAEDDGDDDGEGYLDCEVVHVDGTFNALERNTRLDWLRADVPDGKCRILTNARCLSEGVDVPALDAVMFLSPRKSVVDVVQSVGRVMRKAPG